MIIGFDTYESSKEGGKNVLMYDNVYVDLFNNNEVNILNKYHEFMSKDFPVGFRNIPDKIKLYRLITNCRDKKDINLTTIGIHFVADKKLLNEEFVSLIDTISYKDVLAKYFIVTIETSWNNIDVDKTLAYNIWYPDEHEFTLKYLSFSEEMKSMKILDIEEVEMDKEKIRSYFYRKESKVYEFSDSLYLPNGTSKVSFLEETAYPFLYFTNMEDEDKLFIGKGGSTHGSIVRKIVDIYGSDDYSDSLIRCKGRIFTNEKVLTFWDYPENKKEMVGVVYDLQEKLKRKIFGDGYRLELTEDSKDYNRVLDYEMVALFGAKFVNLDEYLRITVKKPVEFSLRVERIVTFNMFKGMLNHQHLNFFILKMWNELSKVGAKDIEEYPKTEFDPYLIRFDCDEKDEINLRLILVKYEKVLLKANIYMTYMFEGGRCIIYFKSLFTGRVKPNEFIYHVSLEKNRESILKNGLVLKSSSESRLWNSAKLSYPPAVFATNSNKGDTWHDGADVWQIDTEGLPNKWWYDLNFFYGKQSDSDKKFIMTFESIPADHVKLINPPLSEMPY